MPVSWLDIVLYAKDTKVDVTLSLLSRSSCFIFIDYKRVNKLQGYECYKVVIKCNMKAGGRMLNSK